MNKFSRKYVRNPRNKKQVLGFTNYIDAKSYINKAYKKPEYFVVVLLRR